jgi:poly-beta-1,6-N-acetyl-D-glucosamine synthase
LQPHDHQLRAPGIAGKTCRRNYECFAALAALISFVDLMILLYVIIVLFILYSFLVIYYWRSWQCIPAFIPSKEASIVYISVVIPARNEEAVIGRLLQALHDQTYPVSLFEVIVIDDHSTDDTAKIVQQFPLVKLISLQDDNINSYKKKAIERGISAAQYACIVTTDADCVPPTDWLQTLAAFKQEKQAVFVAAPVSINCNSSVLQIFQSMDFMVLQGITGAAVHRRHLSMCNGANLAYDRAAFYKVDGFAGIDSIASGDDMLLMHKIARSYPGQVYYLKSTDAIVGTEPMKTWRNFFNQRIRWASKAARYDDKRIFPVLLLVYLFNCCFPALFIAGFSNYQYWIYLAVLWLLKTLVEFPLFMSVAAFFNKQWANKLFFFFQPLHIAYTIVSGLLGQFGKYEWKGRKVS